MTYQAINVQRIMLGLEKSCNFAKISLLTPDIQNTTLPESFKETQDRKTINKLRQTTNSDSLEATDLKNIAKDLDFLRAIRIFTSNDKQANSTLRKKHLHLSDFIFDSNPYRRTIFSPLKEKGKDFLTTCHLSEELLRTLGHAGLPRERIKAFQILESLAEYERSTKSEKHTQ